MPKVIKQDYVLKKDAVPPDGIKKLWHAEDDFELVETEIEISYQEAGLPGPEQELLNKLRDTDYIGTRIAEGSKTQEDYSAIIAQREKWREELRELRKEQR